MLVPAGARIVYFTQISFNVVVCCFGFTLWVGLVVDANGFWSTCLGVLPMLLSFFLSFVA